jgi:hypothetical protein
MRNKQQCFLKWTCVGRRRRLRTHSARVSRVISLLLESVTSWRSNRFGGKSESSRMLSSTWKGRRPRMDVINSQGSGGWVGADGVVASGDADVMASSSVGEMLLFLHQDNRCLSSLLGSINSWKSGGRSRSSDGGEASAGSRGPRFFFLSHYCCSRGW